jgi:hypothetical protein
VDSVASPLTFVTDSVMTCRVEPRLDLEGIPSRDVSIQLTLDGGQNKAQQTVPWQLKDARPGQAFAAWGVFGAVALALMLMTILCCLWPAMRVRAFHIYSRCTRKRGESKQAHTVINVSESEDVAGPDALIDMLETKMHTQDNRKGIAPIVLADYLDVKVASPQGRPPSPNPTLINH